MTNSVISILGKTFSLVSQTLNIGSGSTWPGHIALKLNHKYITELLTNSNVKVAYVAGTNGKTTTAKMISAMIQCEGKTNMQNPTGANLLNGIASALIDNSTLGGKISKQFAIFEVDENTLPLLCKEYPPDFLVILNLFRDQLDRYGEVNTIADKWQKAVKSLPLKTTVILNADDPLVSFIGNNRPNTFFLGLDEKIDNKEITYDAVDSTHCPHCGVKLAYKNTTYSHLGDWYCTNCKKIRPRLTLSKAPLYPLLGTYNKYNTIAAVLLAEKIGISKKAISEALSNFKPAFGRQEKITLLGKQSQIFLSKNPTSMNESLKTIKDLGAKYVLLILNDRIPDGRDISWIWDVDFEKLLSQDQSLFVAGDRASELALRLAYTQPIAKNVNTIHEINAGSLSDILAQLPKNETLYILPTYSAMLELRQVLKGKKIL